VSDLAVVGIKRDDVNVVRNGRLAGGRGGRSRARVSATEGREESSRVVLLIDAGVVNFITASGHGGVGQASHPVGVVFESLDVQERLGLGCEGGVGLAVLVAVLPALARLAGVKELLNVLHMVMRHC